MPLRLLYLIFARLGGWLALITRSVPSKEPMAISSRARARDTAFRTRNHLPRRLA